jgi:hypothetical protein
MRIMCDVYERHLYTHFIYSSDVYASVHEEATHVNVSVETCAVQCIPAILIQ